MYRGQLLYENGGLPRKAVSQNKWLQGACKLLRSVSFCLLTQYFFSLETSIPDFLVAMFHSYQNARSLLLETDLETEKYEITLGVPQDSILGPFI